MYSKVEARFWLDEKVQALSIDGHYLMLYLLTTPHKNVVGCYKLPKSYAQEDTCLTEERFNTAWEEVIKSGMILYDNLTKTVLVRNYLKYNPIEGPKQAAGAIKKLCDMPKSKLLLNVIVVLQEERDRPYLKQLIDYLYNLLNPEKADNPSDTLSGSPCDTVSDSVLHTNDDTSAEGYAISVNSKQRTENSKVTKEEKKDACAREEAKPNNIGFAEVLAGYQSRVNATPSRECIDLLRDYTEQLSPEVVIKAIESAADDKKTSWSYIRAVLLSWKRKGVKSLADVAQAQDEFNQTKARIGTYARGQPPKSAGQEIADMIANGEFRE